jgi:hypothetical protein
VTPVPKPSVEGCDFCAIVRGDDRSVQIVCESDDWIAFFPLNPATKGHTLVVPRHHIADIWELDNRLASELMAAVIRVGRAVQAYAEDYQAIFPLKELADAYGVSIVVVHHQRKLDAEDPLDTISGTTGLTGAADASLVLKKTRLEGRGRDIEGDIAWSVAFDEDAVTWQRVGAEILVIDDDSVADRLAAELAPGDRVPGRQQLAECYGLRKEDAEREMRRIRKDARFTSSGPRAPIFRAPNAADTEEGLETDAA